MASFLLQVFKNPFSTGGVAPCGPKIIASVTHAAAVSTADQIVELGPGTGVFTQAIDRQRKEGSQFFAVEINPEFAAITRSLCPNVQVFEGSAADLKSFLPIESWGKVDVVVSTLPWSLLSKELQSTILDTVVQCLKPGGRFLTVMYVQSRIFPMGIRFAKMLRQKFVKVERLRPVWDGPFPMFAYSCLR